MAKRNLSGDMGMERGRVYKRSKVTPNEKAKRAYIAKLLSRWLFAWLRRRRRCQQHRKQASTPSLRVTHGSPCLISPRAQQRLSAWGRRSRYDGYDTVGRSSTTRHHYDCKACCGYFLDQDTPGVGTEMFEQSLRASGPQTFSAIKGRTRADRYVLGPEQG